MNHVSDEQLVLLYYGEATEPGLETHLAGCPTCRGARESLRALLDSVRDDVPERGAAYGARVWERLAPRLRESTGARVIRPSAFAPRFALAAIAASVLVAAFLAGRFWQQADKGADPISASSRERVLQLAVGDHLQRSQTMLTELVNSSATEPVSARGQERVEELVSTNRLYRQTASRSGDAAVAEVLEQLERVLVEVARSPSPLSAQEQDSLRRRIEGQGLLFKVRVMGARLREQERPRELPVADNRERKRT